MREKTTPTSQYPYSETEKAGRLYTPSSFFQCMVLQQQQITSNI